MTRIKPKTLEEIPSLKTLMQKIKKDMGFLPIDALVMAHCPEMLKSVEGIIDSILRKGKIEPKLKRLIGFLTNQIAGCRYCSAHIAYSALKLGLDKEKMKALWEYSNSPLFSPKEKAALQLTHHVAITPNEATEADFDNLRKYFNPEEIVEIVFTISVYSFLNKFNNTIKTDTEKITLAAYNQVKLA